MLRKPKRASGDVGNDFYRLCYVACVTVVFFYRFVVDHLNGASEDNNKAVVPGGSLVLVCAVVACDSQCVLRVRDVAIVGALASTYTSCVYYRVLYYHDSVHVLECLVVCWNGREVRTGAHACTSCNQTVPQLPNNDGCSGDQ